MTTFDTVYCLADKQKSGGCVAVMAKSGWSCGFGRANRARKSPGFSGKIGEGSGRRDSNPRQPAWKAGTLPTELLPLASKMLPEGARPLSAYPLLAISTSGDDQARSSGESRPVAAAPPRV